MHITRILAVYEYKAHVNALFCMTLFFIPNPIQFLPNLTITLLTINKQEFIETKVVEIWNLI